MAQQQDFSGVWQSVHWYPTKDDAAEESSKYDMKVFQTGHDLVFQSTPMDDGSYMLIRLSVDGNVATGTWYENTSPGGDFASTMYSGAGQLIISEDGKHMEGLWAGAGFDHEANKPRVYTGRWELHRLGEK
jgi:hypothetical protein